MLRPSCQVFVAPTAGVALRVLHEHAIDLIVEDVRLPDRDGIDLLREVKALRPDDIGVIVMTGRGTLKSAEEALEYGAIAYLLKPFSFQELLDLVQDAKRQVHQ